MLEDETVITSELVSRFYRAPEILLGCPYDTKIDIWSLGCTLYELYTGKILFPGRNNNDMMKLIMQIKGKIPNKLIKKGVYSQLYFTESGDFISREKDSTKEMNIGQFPNKDLLTLLKSSNPVSSTEEKSLLVFRDFLEKLLNLDPNKRLCALDALYHPFLEISPVFK